MRYLIAFVVMAALFACVTLSTAEAAPEGERRRAECGENLPVVVLKKNANVDQVLRRHERQYGFRECFVYRYALNGYAAPIDPSLLPAIEADPQVLFVDPPDESEGLRSPALPGGLRLEATAAAAVEQPAQALGNGVRRVGGDLSSAASGDGRGRVNINVAVLDTGIQPDHPDLNVAGGINCQPGRSDDFADRNGHGTMVGGFIGAQDNRIGRVGVAPGARLYGVRVLDDVGFGFYAAIVCGLDWVASSRVDRDPQNDIAVANMSLGGPEQDDQACGITVKDALHFAICGMTANGVVPVASAGNETFDIADQGPATYSEVLTVTAMSDKDGQQGALGGNLTCEPEEVDDTAATFSNFATLPEDQAHVVTAPGSCISSTYIGSQYAVWSGTSFASPLAAGTVALCIANGPCRGLTPAQVVRKIVNDARRYNERHPEYGFTGDPLRPVEGRYYGFLIHTGLY